MTIGRGVTDPDAPYMRDGDPRTSGQGFGLMMHPNRLDQPLRWTRPRRIFTTSMGDLFHPEVTDDFLDHVFGVMMVANWHTFQVLSKRPERMRAYFTDPETIARVALASNDFRSRGTWAGSPGWPLPNVHLGTSVENARWRTRIDELRQTPSVVRFLSMEPLLGPLVPGLDLRGVNWGIIGGESGGGARPIDEQWVRDIVAECRRQHVAVFVKQFGEIWSREHLGHGGHAGDIDTFPEDLRIREFPGDQHHWVDARNQAVMNGSVCLECGAIKAENTEPELALNL